MVSVTRSRALTLQMAGSPTGSPEGGVVLAPQVAVPPLSGFVMNRDGLRPYDLAVMTCCSRVCVAIKPSKMERGRNEGMEEESTRWNNLAPSTNSHGSDCGVVSPPAGVTGSLIPVVSTPASVASSSYTVRRK